MSCRAACVGATFARSLLASPLLKRSTITSYTTRSSHDSGDGIRAPVEVGRRVRDALGRPHAFHHVDAVGTRRQQHHRRRRGGGAAAFATVIDIVRSLNVSLHTAVVW